MMKFSKKVKALLGTLVVLGQVAVSSLLPVVATAGVVFPKEVTIEFDSNNLYTMTGQYSDGTFYSKKDAPLFAVYEGNRQPVFCYEPNVGITSTVTSGYQENPLPDMVKNNQRAKYISVLWKYAGTDSDTQIVAQAMFWKEVNGLNITKIVRPNGTVVTNQNDITNIINRIVDDYAKKPSFDGQTVTVNLGESVTLTDTNGSNLESYARAVLNTAGVDWSINGNNLTITPNKDSKEFGNLRLVKTIDEGTPIAYKKIGQQGVYAGAIDDPNSTQINMKVNKTGEVKITKLDKGTGQVVPNTEFKVEYDGKTQTVKTDNKGEAVAKDIPHDSTVKVTETFVPAPYILDTNNTKEVVVKAGKVATAEFKNERATGKSTISKVDETTSTTTPLNPNYPMTGAKYGWFKADGTLIKEFTLGEELTATIDKQELGSYYWQETVAPVGYTLDTTKHVVDLVYKDQYTPVVVKNGESKDDVVRMNIDGQKLIQNATNEMFKNGVELTLTNKRTNETQVVTTATVDGKKGYFSFKDIALDDYVLTETKGVEGYNNIDPIEITHSYDKTTESFVFTVKDQKTGNVLNEESFTQLELSKGINVDLGTYTLKDKAKLTETPVVGISTQAHTGDGKTQTFVWGEDMTFYDDVKITHKNINDGTVRAFETILVAVDTDGNEKDVWTSGKIDYTVTDKEMTERVIAEYDYKKDKEGTRYYFKEIGYSKDGDKYEKDAEHNFDGKEKTQDITPIIAETPEGSLPYTGEQVTGGLMVLGTMILVGVVGYLTYSSKRKNRTNE